MIFHSANLHFCYALHVMRQRQIDPLLRGVGILWAVFSLMIVVVGIRAIWTGYPEAHAAKQIWVGIGFVVFGGFFAAIGLAMAFSKKSEGKASPLNNRNRGMAPGLTPVIFCLMFSTAGLVLLGASLFPGVFEGIRIGERRISPIGIVAALCCLGFGIYGLWGAVRRRSKRQERSLRSAQDVAAARERRRNAKPKRKRR